MSGGAMPEQGGGGRKKKKALDANINVVPAIDLLSCCITFLLYTAVWTQISRLQVQQLGTGAPDLASVEQQQKSLAVTLAVGERGMALMVGDASYGADRKQQDVGADADIAMPRRWRGHPIHQILGQLVIGDPLG